MGLLAKVSYVAYSTSEYLQINMSTFRCSPIFIAERRRWSKYPSITLLFFFPDKIQTNRNQTFSLSLLRGLLSQPNRRLLTSLVIRAPRPLGVWGGGL